MLSIYVGHYQLRFLHEVAHVVEWQADRQDRT